MTPAQFTEEYAGALRATVPSIQVQIEKDLQLKLTAADGRVGFSLLFNVWNDYLLAPENKERVMQNHFRSICETSKLLDAPPDKTRILPVLKPKQWIQNHQALLKTGSGEKVIEVVYEPYTDELIVVYAEDTPNDILYPAPERLKKLNLNLADLRQLACHNLRELLPTPKVQFTKGFCWIWAGGSYEASLLLLEDFWDHGKLDVSGEIVVAVPARNYLFVTGSQDAAKVEKLRQLAQLIEAREAHPLTSRLLVRRQGRFATYET